MWRGAGSHDSYQRRGVRKWWVRSVFPGDRRNTTDRTTKPRFVLPQRPPQYHGPLTAAEAGRGINTANANAVRLVEDAILLYEYGRYGSAAALAVSAIEEAAKRHIILAIAAWGPQRGLWRAFRDHVEKIKPSQRATGHRLMTTDEATTEYLSKHDQGREFLEHRELGLYVDALAEKGRVRWWQPGRSFTKRTARRLIELAAVMTIDDRASTVSTERVMSALRRALQASTGPGPASRGSGAPQA
jgi:AbiV family abortive infection protein